MASKIVHRSTSRVLDVLEFVASKSGSYTLTEICNAIGAPKSSMFPIIHTLYERKYLALNKETGKYSINYMAFQVGSAFLNNFDIAKQLENEMNAIVKSCRETCQFATLVEDEVLYLKKVDSPETILMTSTIGRRRPAYATGLGKALIIDSSLADLKSLFPGGLKSLTHHTITDFDVLEKQLAKARIEGVTYEVEESREYVRCIAIPIRKNGKVVAAMSVAIPTFRYTDQKGELIKKLLFQAKEKVENWLKFSPMNFSAIF